MNVPVVVFTFGFLAAVLGCGADSHGESTNSSAMVESPMSDSGDIESASTPIEELDLSALPEAPFDVFIGTGRETFVPLMDGQTLFLELGHQGLQHVLVSIRVQGLPQDRYVVDFQLTRDDGVAISEPARLRLPFKEIPDEEGVELLGYTLVVGEPSLGVGQSGTLRATVEDPDGLIAADERSVNIEWAPEGWNPDA